MALLLQQWSRRRRDPGAASLGASRATAHGPQWSLGLQAHMTQQLDFFHRILPFVSHPTTAATPGWTVNEIPSTPWSVDEPPSILLAVVTAIRAHRSAVRSEDMVLPPCGRLVGKMRMKWLPAGRLSTASASACATAAKRDGHALRSPKQGPPADPSLQQGRVEQVADRASFFLNKMRQPLMPIVVTDVTGIDAVL